MLENRSPNCTEDLRAITEGLVQLSKELDTHLQGHDQERNAQQIKIYALRLRNILSPILGHAEEAQPRYTIFDPIYTPASAAVKHTANKPRFGANILVVEDQKYHQIVAKEILSILGCQTECVEDSEAAIAKMLNKRYDLIFLDIDINGTSGIDVARRYRQDEPFAQPVPLVSMTSMTSPTTHKNCRAAGINAITEKPYEVDKIMEILPHFLKPSAKS